MRGIDRVDLIETTLRSTGQSIDAAGLTQLERLRSLPKALALRIWDLPPSFLFPGGPARPRRRAPAGPTDLLPGLGVAEPDARTLVFSNHVGVVGRAQRSICLREGCPASVTKANLVVAEELKNFDNAAHNPLLS